MNQILFINACARPVSRTCRLARHVLKNLDGKVTELRLYDLPLAPLDNTRLEARNAGIASGTFTGPLFSYARQFAQADTIVVAAPYWDLAFPSILKVYLEHVTITGVTFDYSPEGIPRGRCRADRLIYVTTAGGPLEGLNLGYDYVRTLCRTFYGIAHTCCFYAQNLDVMGTDTEGLLQAAEAAIDRALG